MIIIGNDIEFVCYDGYCCLRWRREVQPRGAAVSCWSVQILTLTGGARAGPRSGCPWSTPMPMAGSPMSWSACPYSLTGPQHPTRPGRPGTGSRYTPASLPEGQTCKLFSVIFLGTYGSWHVHLSDDLLAHAPLTIIIINYYLLVLIIIVINNSYRANNNHC